MRVDLHCHSTASDGCLPPGQVAARMAARGVRAAALTDHHTFAGQQRFRAALEARGVQFVTGVEIQVESPLGSLHLLAYGCDIRDHALSRILRVMSYPVWGPVRHWMERTWVRGAVSPDSLGEPAAVAHGGLDSADALRVIHAAGGLAFIAHPFLTAADSGHLEAQVELLRSQGLDGIEAFYKPHAREAQEALLELAHRHDLLVSAGSDFHGPLFPETGPGFEMPDAEWRRLADALGLEPER